MSLKDPDFKTLLTFKTLLALSLKGPEAQAKVSLASSLKDQEAQANVSLALSLRGPEASDELMLNVLRCHLTY